MAMAELKGLKSGAMVAVFVMPCCFFNIQNDNVRCFYITEWGNVVEKKSEAMCWPPLSALLWSSSDAAAPGMCGGGVALKEPQGEGLGLDRVLRRCYLSLVFQNYQPQL